MRTVSQDALRRQLREVFNAWGVSRENSDIIVENMVESDLRGIDSHGVGMLPKYDEYRRNGALDPKANMRIVRDFGAIALIDADHGLGHAPATRAMQMACDKAEQFGVGVASVRNSNHFGAAGVYASMAADRGLIGMCMTGTTQRSVLPTFGKEPRFSTNPIAFAAPAKRNNAFSLDMATSTVAVGKLNIARRAEKPLPIGWAHDDQGRPTTDPVAALSATPKRLSPLGGTRELGSHKGYGLAVMVDILSSVLSGSLIGGHDPKTGDRNKYINVGHFCLALNPEAFREEGEFEDNMDDLLDMLRDTIPVDKDQPVLVAGDPEYAEHARRSAEGVPMTDILAGEIREVAEQCGAPYLLGN